MSGKPSLLKASSLLFTGSMVANLCNYLFQILMGRWLSVADYGIMNSLIALFMIAAVPGVTITLVITKYTSGFQARQESERISGIFYAFLKVILICVGLGFLVFLSLSPHISTYLNIPSITPTMLTGVALFFAFLVPVNQGLLQGLQQFGFLSLVVGLGAGFKLLFALVLVYLGFRVNGVMIALALSGLAVFLLTFFYLRLRGDVVPLSQAKLFKIGDRKGVLNYSIPVMVASILFSLLSQLDMVLVKHYFSAQQAGLYASAAVLGRVVLCLPAAIVMALFPMVAGLHSLNEDTSHVLNKGLIYTGLLAGGGVLLFWLMPEFLLKIMFGQKFVAAAPLLGLFGLAMFPLAMLGILINFNLARHQVKFIYPLLLGTILQVGLIHLYHRTLSQVLWIMVAGGTSLLIANLAMVFWERFSMVQPVRVVEEGS